MPILKSDAFRAWDRASESLEDTEQRIHDGASTAEELNNRARAYVETMVELFPYAMPRQGAVIMEIGSGVGYVMEAAMRKFRPAKLIGLDVAPSMVEKAKKRISRDVRETLPFEFLLYDGVGIPVEDNSVDYVYSVASLQHVPKELVYNLVYEISRILKSDGRCVIHLAFCKPHCHSQQNDRFPAGTNRTKSTATTRTGIIFTRSTRLSFFLADAAQVREIDVVDGQVSIWLSFGNTGRVLRNDDLLRKTHLGRESEAYVVSKLGEFERRAREAERG